MTKLPHRWSLLTDLQQGKIRPIDDFHLVAPKIHGGSMTPLLSGLLPNRNHNEDLLGGLDCLPRAGAAAQPVLSVFAADPFIEGKRIAPRLLERGYKRIVNWPTTAQYGTAFCELLDSVDLGPRQEYDNLRRHAERGLSVSLAVCTADVAAALSIIKPELLFLAPSFDLWVNGTLRSMELLQRCEQLARVVQGNIPIVLMATRGIVSPSRAVKAGATGLLVA